MIKNLLAIAVTAAVFVSVHVSAQVADLYPILPGGTTYLAANSTNVINPSVAVTNTFSVPGVGPTAANTNLILMSVSEFDYVGLTFGFTGTATSTNDLYIYKSYDKAATFETVASFQYLGIAPGANAYETNAALDVHGVTTLAFVFKNRGTTVSTNVLAELLLKSPKVGAKPSTR